MEVFFILFGIAIVLFICYMAYDVTKPDRKIKRMQKEGQKKLTKSAQNESNSHNLIRTTWNKQSKESQKN